MISPSRSIRAGALMTVLSLAMAACSSTPPGASTAPGASTPPASSAGASSAAPSGSPDGSIPAPEVSKLNVGVSVTEVSQYAAILAEQLKIYEKYGLTANYTVFDGDGKAVAALQAGQVDVALTGSSSAISSQLTDAPFKVVAVNASIVTDDLVCQPAIKTGADVKGKSIAISTFGGTSNASALLALKSLNYALTDAVITQVGGQDARIAALKGKSIDCAIIDSNLESDMTGQGFSIVVQLKKSGVPYGRSGMDFLQSFIDKNPNTVLATVASVLEAQNTIFATPDKVIPLYADFTQTDTAAATKQVQDFTTVGNRSLMWKDEAFKNAQKVIAIINPDIIDVDVTKAFDRSYLQKLVDNGFYAKIGDPATTP